MTRIAAYLGMLSVPIPGGGGMRSWVSTAMPLGLKLGPGKFLTELFPRKLKCEGDVGKLVMEAATIQGSEAIKMLKQMLDAEARDPAQYDHPYALRHYEALVRLRYDPAIRGPLDFLEAEHPYCEILQYLNGYFAEHLSRVHPAPNRESVPHFICCGRHTLLVDINLRNARGKTVNELLQDVEVQRCAFVQAVVADSFSADQTPDAATAALIADVANQQPSATAGTRPTAFARLTAIARTITSLIPPRALGPLAGAGFLPGCSGQTPPAALIIDVTRSHPSSHKWTWLRSSTDWLMFVLSTANGDAATTETEAAAHRTTTFLGRAFCDTAAHLWTSFARPTVRAILIDATVNCSLLFLALLLLLHLWLAPASRPAIKPMVAMINSPILSASLRVLLAMAYFDMDWSTFRIVPNVRIDHAIQSLLGAVMLEAVRCKQSNASYLRMYQLILFIIALPKIFLESQPTLTLMECMCDAGQMLLLWLAISVAQLRLLKDVRHYARHEHCRQTAEDDNVEVVISSRVQLCEHRIAPRSGHASNVPATKMSRPPVKANQRPRIPTAAVLQLPQVYCMEVL